MTTRRQFIRGAVSAAVAASLWASSAEHRRHEWRGDTDMCLRCRMTVKMVLETERYECPGTALYDYRHVTYRTEWMIPKCANVGTRYAEMLAHSMRQTQEMVATNVFNMGA